jgi:hypothetical protein
MPISAPADVSVPNGDIKLPVGYRSYDGSSNSYKVSDSWENHASSFDIRKRLPVMFKSLAITIALLVYTSSAKLVTRFNAGPTYQFVLYVVRLYFQNHFLAKYLLSRSVVTRTLPQTSISMEPNQVCPTTLWEIRTLEMRPALEAHSGSTT